VLRGALHDQEFSHGIVYKRNFSLPEKGAEPLREAGPETRIEIGKNGLVPGAFFACAGGMKKFLFWTGAIFVIFGWIMPWTFLSIIVGYWILKD